jgi:hypothetical protein
LSTQNKDGAADFTVSQLVKWTWLSLTVTEWEEKPAPIFESACGVNTAMQHRRVTAVFPMPESERTTIFARNSFADHCLKKVIFINSFLLITLRHHYAYDKVEEGQ